MRSPHTVPLVIQHRPLPHSSSPAQSIPIPSRAAHDLQHSRSSPAHGLGLHDGAENGDVDVDMDKDGSGFGSPPALTTGQSLDEGEYLLTPPGQLLFGSLTPLHAASGIKDSGLEIGNTGNKGKSRGEFKGLGSGESLLLQTPPEILHRILCSSAGMDVKNIARAAGTCRELRSFIYENPDQALWRDVHLNMYDDPRASDAHKDAAIDWKQRVQDRERVQAIFDTWSEDHYDELPERLDLICNTLLDMYLDLPPVEDPTRAAPAKDDEAADDISIDTDVEQDSSTDPEPCNMAILHSLLSSPLFEHLVLHCATRDTRPLLRPIPGRMGSPLRRTCREIINPTLSRLHCLLPPSLDKGDKLQCDYRGFVRELVYSSQYYQERNEWAPLDERGRVDWKLVDAISTVMMANAKDVIAAGESSWEEAKAPLASGLSAVRSWGYGRVDRPLHLQPTEVWDWAGVEGRWCGSYAFLDYSDWMALNEPRIVLLRRSMADLDLAHYTEAVGDLLHMQLQLVNPIEHAEKLAKRRVGAVGHSAEDLLPLVKSSLPTSGRLPPIHFKGVSAQANGSLTHPSSTPHSTVRGVVQLTADDPPQVRWTVVIRYTGADRWKIEGVQVGGRGSKRGFFGIWTDAEKEEHSPNGPTWYWKA